jgi:cytochrome c oxidase subunit 2
MQMKGQDRARNTRITPKRNPVSAWVYGLMLLTLLLAITVAAPAQGPPVKFSDVHFDQQLDQQVPLDLKFRDESGQTVRLGDYFGKKPVILSLVYYECPMLCTQVLNGQVTSLSEVSFNVGEQFNVVTVSFNPRETPALAAAKKEMYLSKYDRPGAKEGWHFLTGDPKEIASLADSVGFHYVYDALLNQYAHASGIMVLTPQGRISRYFYGIDYSPRDLRLGLVEASEGKIGSPVDQIMLLCYHYDAATGKYAVMVTNSLRIGGVIIVLLIVTLFFWLQRRVRKGKPGRDATRTVAGFAVVPILALFLPFTPDQASSMSGQVDALYAFLLGVAFFFGTLIAGLEIFFAIRYRRRSKNEFPPATTQSLKLEIAWTVIPFIIAMIIFVWGAKLYFDIYRNPSDAVDVYVTAKQWMWRFQHADGRREINELHVPLGRKIKLILASEDVIHSFFVPAFRIKTDVVPGPGRYITLWFQPTQTGRYHLFCSQYCGLNHSLMGGWIEVMSPVDYEAWVSGSGTGTTMAASGEKLFQQLACVTCHKSDGSGRGPRLEGVFSSTVRLDNGQSVKADESYIRESILDSQAKIVAGYARPSLMPTFQSVVNEEQLSELLAYIKSIGPQEGATGTAAPNEPKQSGNATRPGAAKPSGPR